MASLTGTKVSDTYQQLLKLTSQGVSADASAKYIEDGLGTDTALSLSTTRAGIGTDSPTTKLHLSDGASTAVIAKFTNDTTGNTINDGSSIGIDGDGDLLIYNVENKEIKFYTNDTLRAVIDNSGNVGINTDSPGYQLDLRRNDTGTTTSLGIRQLGSGDASMAFQTTTSPYGFCIGVDGSDSDAFKIATGTDDIGTNTKLTITTGGDVGIGSDSPDTKLNLKDTGSIEVRLEADSNNSGQEDCFIRFYTDGKTQEGIVGMDNNNSSTLFSSNTENAMVFGCVSNLPVVFATNNTERMQITADGEIQYRTTGDDHYSSQVEYVGNDDIKLHFGPNYSFESGFRKVLTLDNQKVGIGEENPTGLLELSASGNTNKYLTLDNATGNNFIQFGSDAGAYACMWTEYGSGDLYIGTGVKPVGTNTNAFYSSYGGGDISRTAIVMDAFGDEGIKFHTASESTVAKDSAVTNDMRMRITPAGVIGIETGDSSGTGATRGIHIDTTGVPFLRYQETNSSGGTADYEIYVANGVYVLYDNDDSAGVYSVSTSQVISGDFNDTSDIGLKENIKTIDSGLSVVNKLNPVTFDWKNKKKGSNSGFIAQEVEKLLPDDVEGEDFNTDYPSGRIGDVIENEDKGFNNFGKSINMGGIVAHLTKAIQELSAKVEKLSAKVEELEPAEQDDGPVNSVKERVNSLEARVNDLENG